MALLFDPNAPLLAAILGVLKAGKTYVPLDPSLPPARMSALLEDLQTGLIISDGQHLPLASALADDRYEWLNIEEIDANTAMENLGRSPTPDSLAGIIYTSGSTGQPKGIMQDHCHILHNVMNHTNSFRICADDRLIVLASSITAQVMAYIYSALLNGAGVYLLDIKKDGLFQVADWLSQHKSTIYCSIPTVFPAFRGMLQGGERFPSLRLIHVGGEPVYQKDIDLYKRLFPPSCLFVNRPGLTETGSVRWYFTDQNTTLTDSVVPVGYAVEGTEILILDAASQRIGVDCVGEIAVKSRYLTRGYWRNQELTPAAFALDCQDRNAWLYRTGDLGCLRPDGCLVHLGRQDFQVKVRGNRVQVAEIERVLHEHPAIKEAVVIAQPDRSHDTSLVASVVPARQPSPTNSELRRFVQDRLADYMTPAACVVLDALPLMHSGKVDRQALLSRSPSRPLLARPFIAPRTPIEQTVAAIWAEVLGLERVGIYDQFLELGGHSLLATQVVSRVLQTFRVNVPLRVLVESPTVAEMAVVIMQSLAQQTKHEDVERVLAELETLTDEQVLRRLASETRRSETSGA